MPIWLLLVLLCVWPVQAKEVVLPQPPQPIVDLMGSIELRYQTELTQKIAQLEREQHWQVRILVQKDDIPGKQIKTYWGLNERSILIVVNLKKRNPLFFNVGDAAYQKLPRFFWRELQARYGNQFYIGEHGRGEALVQTIGAITESLHEGGRATVPGLPREHWILTFISSALGGLVLGFACHPREGNPVWYWQGIFFSAPLWAILFVIFGLGVVVIRTNDPIPVLENSGGFIAAALIAFLIPTPKRAKLDFP